MHFGVLIIFYIPLGFLIVYDGFLFPYWSKGIHPHCYYFFSNFRQPELVNGALIHGIESRVNVIESKLSDIDARTSEESDNALNERELDRFIMSGNNDFVLSCFV